MIAMCAYVCSMRMSYTVCVFPGGTRVAAALAASSVMVSLSVYVYVYGGELELRSFDIMIIVYGDRWSARPAARLSAFDFLKFWILKLFV